MRDTSSSYFAVSRNRTCVGLKRLSFKYTYIPSSRRNRTCVGLKPEIEAAERELGVGRNRTCVGLKRRTDDGQKSG